MGCNDPLATDLIGLVDDLRGIAEDFGLRPLRTYLVWVGWTRERQKGPVLRGDMTPDEAWETFNKLDLDPDTIGVGDPTMLYEEELTPAPEVMFDGIGKDLDSLGLTERGIITCRKISARYSEDFLMGLRQPFRDVKRPNTLKKGVDFFWELREDRSRGFIAPGYEAQKSAVQELNVIRRRFHPADVPGRNPGKFEWRIALRRADGERTRTGGIE